MEKPDILLQRPDHSDRSSDNKNIVLLYLEFLVIHILKEVELIGTEQNILSIVCKGNYSRNLEELVARAT